jgi:S1-C subfamily serine protease
VVEIAADHPFAKAGLQKDDVILEALGTDIVSINDIQHAGGSGKNRPPRGFRVLRMQKPVVITLP